MPTSRPPPDPSRPPPQGAPATSVGAYYPWLDALRGVSWILVMVGHTTSYGYLARMGVGIFFAISGWLITKIILGQIDASWSLARFYTRRALRIIPLYYVLIAVAVASSLLVPAWKAYFEWLPSDVPEHALWRYLLGFATEYWRGGGGGFLVGHAWSLDVEERFYVFWPLLLTLWPRFRGARQLLVVALVVLWSLALGGFSTEDVTIALWAMPFPLLLGCALAIFSPFRLRQTSKLVTFPLAAAALAAYVAYAASTEPRLGPTICTFSLVAALLAAALVACAVATRSEPANGLFRLLQSAGKISYAAYLFHPIFAFLGIKAARAAGVVWLGPALGVALVGPVAYAIHRVVEEPILGTRARVERSPGWRTGLGVLQVTPIVAGLVLLFPWAPLLATLSARAHLRPVLAVAAIAAVGIAAYWSLGRRRRLALDERVRAWHDAVVAAARRRPLPLDVALYLALAGVLLVGLTGGFATRLGPLSLSVHGLQRPALFLAGVLVIRKLLVGTFCDHPLWRRGAGRAAAALDLLARAPPDLPASVRRSTIVLDLVIYGAAAALLLVAATAGGFSTHVGPVPLSLHGTARPWALLVVTLVARKVVFGTFSDARLWSAAVARVTAALGGAPRGRELP